MISRITMIQATLSFPIRTGLFYFLLSVLGDTRRETQFIKPNHTMITLSPT